MQVIRTSAAQAPAVETREEAIAEQPRVRINTPRLHGSVALTGGRIDDLTLATYHETVDPKSPGGPRDRRVPGARAAARETSNAESLG